MRLVMPPSLAVWVADRIANYAAEGTEPYHQTEAPEVAQCGALPLIRHWYETFGLRPDGTIVRWSTIDHPEPYPGLRPVEERYAWVSALLEGARRFPELATLLPSRPPWSADCPCGGGYPERVRHICPACGGLGWVETQDSGLA